MSEISNNDLNDCFSQVFPKDYFEYESDENVDLNFLKGLKFIACRYLVKLQFKINTDAHPDNYSLAMSRLCYLHNHFGKNPELLKNYNYIINDFSNEGIIEPVNDTDTFHATHYLPHQPVVGDQRCTTKRRIVYDSSVKIPGEFSMNDTLHSSPCLLPNILEIFLRFWFRQ